MLLFLLFRSLFAYFARSSFILCFFSLFFSRRVEVSCHGSGEEQGHAGLYLILVSVGYVAPGFVHVILQALKPVRWKL